MKIGENPLDDYEEGIWNAYVLQDKKWWQFWKPKEVYGAVGTYRKIGKRIYVNLFIGGTFVRVED